MLINRGWGLIQIKMKECNLCHKEIKEKKERYVHVEDWNCKRLTRDIWCHLLCFNKAMNRDLTELERTAQDMLKRAKPIFDKIAPQVEEYRI